MLHVMDKNKHNTKFQVTFKNSENDNFWEMFYGPEPHGFLSKKPRSSIHVKYYVKNEPKHVTQICTCIKLTAFQLFIINRSLWIYHCVLYGRNDLMPCKRF